MLIEPDTIYLNRPQSDLTLKDGRLCLTQWPPKNGKRSLKFPIDAFLRSAATELGHRSVGIILSGTGSDGSRGLKTIHEVGGLTIVQKPETAQFEGMPDSALRATTCNLILPPGEMGAALSQHLSTPISSEQVGRITPEDNSRSPIRKLLSLTHNLKLNLYKDGTVDRRIKRRAELLGIRMADYLELLQVDTNDLEQLYYDLLIGVTRFFRDEEAFLNLRLEINNQIITI